MASTFPQPVYGGSLHRIANKPAKNTGARITLHPDHPAMVQARTIFPSTVMHPADSPRLLVSGMNQRKIGRIVTKGKWAGMPIYTLTLEERATCPASCTEWSTCYGNNMHLARRHVAGLALEGRLIDELVALARKHQQGFVVRLHILGDFYSEAYADLWREALAELPELHIFGFTAHRLGTPIGNAVSGLNAAHPDRCRIRFSGADALVIERKADSVHVVCPVQTGATDCCGTCALCWSMGRTVEFVRH